MYRKPMLPLVNPLGSISLGVMDGNPFEQTSTLLFGESSGLGTLGGMASEHRNLHVVLECEPQQNAANTCSSRFR
jgi:hypothetical protein